MVRGAVIVNLLQSRYTVEEDSGIPVCFRAMGAPNTSIELHFQAVGGTAAGFYSYVAKSVAHT